MHRNGKRLFTKSKSEKRILFWLISCLIIFCVFINGEKKAKESSPHQFMLKEELCQFALNQILPFVYYSQEDKEHYVSLWQEGMSYCFPYLCGASNKEISQVEYGNLLTLDDLEPLKEMELDSLSLMELENQGVLVEREEELLQKEDLIEDTEIEPPVQEVHEQNTGKAKEKAQSISIESLTEYKDLVNAFYTIDAAADIKAEKLDAKKMSQVDLRITKNESEPQILIYHTHSQEGFVDSIPGDDSTTIMGVGEHLAQILRDEYGYQVLHHEGKYDVKSRDSAYANSLPELEELLKKYPSIEVIIDLHRDAVADVSNKYVMEWQGKQTARFMFFNGVSQSRKNGEIGYLYNENLGTNLAFSFQMKKLAEEYYPGITRKNYIHAYRYNMHLMPRYTLLELGAQNNTLEEAMNACVPIAHILHMVLSGEEAEYSR